MGNINDLEIAESLSFAVEVRKKLLKSLAVGCVVEHLRMGCTLEAILLVAEDPALGRLHWVERCHLLKPELALHVPVRSAGVVRDPPDLSQI